MLDEIRKEIDQIDDQIKELFEKRMECVSKAAAFKAENKLPTLDSAREREIIARVTEGQPDEFAGYTKTLFNTIFDLSRSYQGLGKVGNTQLAQRIREALENTPKLFPQSSVVACQGIEGAYSQFACEKLFSRPSIMYFNSFDAVFNAVDKGLCQNGILPLENSLHGSVTEVYDLMKKYRFHITRSVKMKINHALLAKAGTRLPEIKEIYSHEQALMQCSDFLKGLNDIKIIDGKNTAAAAKMVADSDRRDIAAISNPRCAELYGLSVLSSDVQNNGNNYTRFICIAKELEIYPGSDKISIMFTVPHKPGSLYGIMSKFASLGVNLTKLESRPIPEMDFEFMFYVELEASVYAEEIVNLISSLDRSPEQGASEQTASEHFAFLGSYSEI
jgi:chorismate mutase/prephenate dehydratase